MTISFPRPTTALATAFCAMAASCKVGPNYHAPPATLPAGYASTQPAVDLGHWWERFNDPQLNVMIERAAQNNLNLRLAEARLIESRAVRDAAVGPLFPTVKTDGSFTRTQISKNGTFSSIGSGGGSGTTGSVPTGSIPFPTRFNLFQANFDASWEIDVFGGTRRSIEAAQADLESQLENRRDILVSLLAEVATDYVLLRGYQREWEIAQGNVKTQTQTVDLTNSRFKAGIASDLDVARAEAQVSTTLATIPSLESLVQQQIHALSVLIGEPPLALEEELSTSKSIPPPPPQVPEGLPSDLLRRRPDVRRAERAMAAATARVGVATADLFPRFSLTGSWGYQSTLLRSWFNAGSEFWSYGPAVSWPIFDAGKIKANIRAADAREEQAIIQYRQAVLSSMQDVVNALVAYEKEHGRLHYLQQAVAANRRSLDLATQLYSKGLVDFLNVLDAQAAVFASEDQMVQSQRTVSTDLVALYKAVGGGWESFEGPAPAATRPTPATEVLKPNFVP